MTKIEAMETALLGDAVEAINDGHLAIAESKAEQATRRLAAFRLQGPPVVYRENRSPREILTGESST